MGKKLSKIIKIDEEKCISCHKCIAACPIKFCNDGSKDCVNVNNDMCIGCGACILACTHSARHIIDDSDDFFNSLSKKEKFIAISAPALISTFPDNYKKFIAYLENIGIETIFDVSFGAELTVKSYIDFIKEKNPKTVIAQPCSAIVTYIQIYQPELLAYLAPVDSPMIHTIKMIDEYFPQYKNYNVLVISPCIAKKENLMM